MDHRLAQASVVSKSTGSVCWPVVGVPTIDLNISFVESAMVSRRACCQFVIADRDMLGTEFCTTSSPDTWETWNEKVVKLTIAYSIRFITASRHGAGLAFIKLNKSNWIWSSDVFEDPVLLVNQFYFTEWSIVILFDNIWK